MNNQLSIHLDENIQQLENAFLDCDDVVKRKFAIGENNDIWMYMIYTDNIVNSEIIENFIMNNLMNRAQITSHTHNGLLRQLNEEAISIGEMEEVTSFDKIYTAILLGDTVLLMDQNDKALIASTKNWPTRGVPKAETEVVVQGPKDAFSESGSTNIVLIRRRIRDIRLKVKRQRIGVRSKTDVAVIYMQDIVREEILQEVLKRLSDIDIDAILDSGYVSQLIEKDWASPFPQMQLTERPDKAASAVLEGRIVLVVDNAPFVIALPVTLNTFFQSAEDYSERFEIMSFMRVIRYAAAFLAIILPGLYIAVTVYHPAMIPTDLALKIASSRLQVPFPAVVEVLIMELAFELLREAGVRLPAPIGSTLGIVGGIIIGQAAVEAGIVGPVVVILSALTGICTFVIPNPSLVNGLRISKYLMIFLASLLGIYGLWIGVILLAIHLAGLKSFGIPYLFPFCSGTINGYSDWKDSIIRAPMFLMKKRPVFARPGCRVRQNTQDRKKGR